MPSVCAGGGLRGLPGLSRTARNGLPTSDGVAYVNDLQGTNVGDLAAVGGMRRPARHDRSAVTAKNQDFSLRRRTFAARCGTRS